MGARLPTERWAPAHRGVRFPEDFNLAGFAADPSSRRSPLRRGKAACLGGRPPGSGTEPQFLTHFFAPRRPRWPLWRGPRRGAAIPRQIPSPRVRTRRPARQPPPGSFPPGRGWGGGGVGPPPVGGHGWLFCEESCPAGARSGASAAPRVQLGGGGGVYQFIASLFA